MDGNLPIPRNLDIEKALLSCIIQDNAIIDDCVAMGITADDFYWPAHATLLESAYDMRNAGKAVDEFELVQYLTDKGKLNSVSGAAYVNEVGGIADIPSFWKDYASTVKELSARRSVIRSCQKTIEAVVKGDYESFDDFISKQSYDMSAVVQNAQATEVTAKVAAEDARVRAQQMLAGAAPPPLMTGLIDLDALMDGMRPPQVIVIGARPGAGKTALGMTISDNVAKAGFKPHFFSLEMGYDELIDRSISIEGEVNMRRIKQRTASVEEVARLDKACDFVGTLPMTIDDQANLSIDQIVARSRRRKARYGLDLIVIDYLQLISANLGRTPRHEQIAHISRTIKQLAKELRIPIICLTQLNRESEKDKDRPPRMSDLRESGAIEQDADKILLLWRMESDDPYLVRGKLAKHRGGDTGEVELQFQKIYTKFSNYGRTYQ